MRIVRRFHSAHSGWLEILEEDGERVLDTEKANYSYGLLQEILEEGLLHIPFDCIRNVLILGLGGGSVVQSLRSRFGYPGRVMAVDIDPVVIRIALEEFGLAADKQLSVIEADAGAFVTRCTKKFDLIIIDLFIHCEVPSDFYDPPFWLEIHRLLRSDGVFIFNAAVGRKDIRKTHELQETMSEYFTYLQVNDVGGHNSLLIGKKSLPGRDLFRT
ncbi:MAG: spermidine synthase [Bacteroidota bacterium]